MKLPRALVFGVAAVVAALLLVSCGPLGKAEGSASSAAAAAVSLPLPGGGAGSFAEALPQLWLSADKPVAVRDFGPGAPSSRAVYAKVGKAQGSAGCGKALPAGLKAGTTAVRTLDSGGTKRQYRLHLPTNTAPAKRLPVVLNFHGRSGTGVDQEAYSNLLPISDRESFVLVSPDGTGTPRGWSAGATPPGMVDDVKFVNDLLDTLERELCLDTARYYATGFSNGGFLASKLGCLMPERLAAVAAVGGVHYPQQQCKAAMPVLAVHGTADEVVPIAGGIVRQWQYPGAYDAINRWAANNGCTPESTWQDLSPSAAEESFDGCQAPVSMVVVANAAHVWPGSSLLPPELRKDISAAELVWSFFSEKRIAGQ